MFPLVEILKFNISKRYSGNTGTVLNKLQSKYLTQVKNRECLSIVFLFAKTDFPCFSLGGYNCSLTVCGDANRAFSFEIEIKRNRSLFPLSNTLILCVRGLLLFLSLYNKIVRREISSICMIQCLTL